MMDNRFTEIADLESLDRFVANLNGSAGVVFKHSDTCGISSRAYTEMSKLELPIGIVIVQHARSVSDEVEIKDVSIVGRYALNFRWSDGHETGIYSFQYLRDLCDSITT